MRRMFLLVVLVALAGIGWVFRDAVLDRFAGWFEKPETEMSEEELATRAQARLETLASGEARGPVGFSEREAQALLRQRMGAALPGFVHDPRVEFDAGSLRISGRVPVDQVPQIRELGDAAMFLPDTADIATRASLIPLGPGRVAVAVDEISIARIPLPGRFIPRVVGRIRGGAADGAPADAIPLTLPPGAESAYLRGDSLILVPARERGRDPGV